MISSFISSLITFSGNILLCIKHILYVFIFPSPNYVMLCYAMNNPPSTGIFFLNDGTKHPKTYFVNVFSTLPKKVAGVILWPTVVRVMRPHQKDL